MRPSEASIAAACASTAAWCASRYREVDLLESAATTEPARPPYCTLRDVTDLARRTASDWSG